MLQWRKDISESLPAARIGHIAIAIDARAVWGEELVVVHGGIGENKQPLRDVAVLEVGGRQWTSPASASGSGPAARAFHSAAAIGRQLYTFGGHVYVKDKRGLQKFDDLWALNSDTWEWTQQVLAEASAAPVARDFSTMVALPGGRLLLYGGLDAAERRLDDAWVFHTSTRVWKEVKATGTKPKPRYGHGMALLAPPATSAAAPLDLLTGPPESTENAAAAAATATAEARVLLFGGETAAGAVNDLWVLRGPGSGDDGSGGAWIGVDAAGSAPSARKGHAVTATAKGALVCGGHTATVGWLRSRTDVYHGDAHLLEVAPGSGLRWVVAARGPTPADDVMAPELAALRTPAPREYHSLTALADGRVLLLGGGNGKEMFGDAWWLDFGIPSRPSSAQQLQQPQLAAMAPAGNEAGKAAGKAVQAASSGKGYPGTQPPLLPPLTTPPKPPAATVASSWWRGGSQTPPSVPPVGLSPMDSLLATSSAAATFSNSSSNKNYTTHQQLSAVHYNPAGSLEGMDSATAAAVVAAAAAAEVESFRERLGLTPQRPSAALPPPLLPAEADEALLAVGDASLAAGGKEGVHMPLSLPRAAPLHVSATERKAAARSAFASSGDGDALRLQDLAVLLSDYKRLARGGAVPLPSIQHSSGNAGRFLHFSATDIKLGDLPHLLNGYRILLAAS